MAILNNPFLKDVRGRFNDHLVIRQYPSYGTTVLSAFPDMSNIKPSEGQKAQRLSFREAQAQAKQRLADPAVKAFYKSLCKPGQRPHNVLISELLKKDPPVEDSNARKVVVVSGKRIGANKV